MSVELSKSHKKVYVITYIILSFKTRYTMQSYVHVIPCGRNKDSTQKGRWIMRNRGQLLPVLVTWDISFLQLHFNFNIYIYMHIYIWHGSETYDTKLSSLCKWMVYEWHMDLCRYPVSHIPLSNNLWSDSDWHRGNTMCHTLVIAANLKKSPHDCYHGQGLVPRITKDI